MRASMNTLKPNFGGGSWSRTNIVYHEGTDLQSAAEHAISTMPPKFIQLTTHSSRHLHSWPFYRWYKAAARLVVRSTSRYLFATRVIISNSRSFRRCAFSTSTTNCHVYKLFTISFADALFARPQHALLEFTVYRSSYSGMIKPMAYISKTNGTPWGNRTPPSCRERAVS